ncbi:ATP-dependent helicase [Maribacter algarum]|uniref:DNA 3'-5' helicase n=1 Tax=Maribacter algarum (ex Zhang et al. 2020) TaxID=2578118 RepID=A0A5S3PVZ4_9FLAO|nr:UvrD-helicase domain-containing protein [Maribacter algarum]TMM59145.1 ATP-dependent helicase [Maribacter algarum]
MLTNSFKIYDASAGSGKTYTLTKAYLKIILSSNEGYRQILAITFTNKAVNEMKGRILESLFVFSKTTSTEKAPSLFIDLLKELSFTAAELQNKSKKALKKILHNYAFFDVSTIDKFTHRLIRTFAKDLKIPQNFEVILDRDLLLDEAVLRLINKAGSDSKLTKVLIDFALEKIDDDKSWDITIDLKKVGNLIFNEADAEHFKKFEDKSIDDFLKLQKTIKKNISGLKKAIVADASQNLQIIDKNGLEHSDFKSSWFPKFMLKIKSGDLHIDFKAGWKQNFDSEPLYAGKCDAAKKPLLDGLQSQFVSLFNSIKNNTLSHQLLTNVYKNIVPLTVLNAIQQEVKTIQNERDQLSISEFNIIISNEIKDQPAPFIYERLGEKYRHYFIDEFQDTSEMQWNNLIPLIDNALSSEVGSLFLVGDAKQAIYRWRGGKAEQFLNLVNSKTNPFVIQPQIEALPSNYRSHEEIIKFNNDFFTSTSPLLNSQIYRTLFANGNQQEFNELKNGFVQLTFLEENDEESLDEQYGNKVLKSILDIRAKGFSYIDICILVRGNKEGVALANFLTQEGVPIISSESLLLKSSPKVQFLVNLLRYQNQPDDSEIAFELLSFLYKDELEQHQFIEAHLENVSILLKNEYRFDIAKMKQASVYDTLETAIKQFDLAPSSDAYINFFMDTVLDIEQKEGTGIPSFLSHWEKKKDKLSITAPSSINAVQIMTIHKSKGLEFEIVIYPYAHSKIYSEIEPKLWLPVEAESFEGFDELLINKKQEVINYSEIAEYLFEEENNKLELDAFNVLYVALTRAVKALYIITKEEVSSKKSDAPKTYSELFIHFLKEKTLWEENKSVYQFGSLDFPREGNKSEEQEDISYQYSYKERDSFKILAKSGVLWDTDSEAALSKGNLIHFMMGLVETEKDIENALAIVIRNGDISKIEIEPMRDMVLQIINHPKLETYYKEGHSIKNERDIITKSGLVLRPDRVVIKENNATVIDYKTGRRDIRYKDQLDSYAHALKEMGYAIENKIIIYINEEITPEFI